MEKPLSYYYNNLVSTMVLSRDCLKHGVGKFMFSSSATVYGENEVPFVEDMKLLEDIFICSKIRFLDRNISMEEIEKKAQGVLDTSCAFCVRPAWA